jgi:hypothetical protein
MQTNTPSPCRARKLSDEQRSAIASYFAVYKGQERGVAKLATALDDHPAIARAYALLRDAFEQVGGGVGVVVEGWGGYWVGHQWSKQDTLCGQCGPPLLCPACRADCRPLPPAPHVPCPCSASCRSSSCWGMSSSARRCWRTCPTMQVPRQLAALQPAHCPSLRTSYCVPLWRHDSVCAASGLNACC